MNRPVTSTVKTARWWKFIRLPLAVAGVGYLGLAFLAPLVAGSLLYHPQRGSQRAPAGLRKISAGTGGDLAVLYLPNPGARFTLWYLHGNAEDLGDVEPQLRAFHRAGYAVFAFDYPGYGHSSGRPSEATLFAATRRAGAYLRHELKVPAAQTLLYGFSLGGGPAVQLATEEKYGGLMLQSTFVSAYRVLTRWRLLPFDQFENLRKLPGVSCPVLVLHGDADPVVSFPHGVALFAAAPEPKRHLWISGAGHNDLPETAGKSYWAALRDFSELCAGSAGAKP